jgi:hypothetical protein
MRFSFPRPQSVRFPAVPAQVSAALSLLSLVAMVLGSLACERFK